MFTNEGKPKILISGGGIAGLTLAYWLDQAGFAPLVLEQAQGLSRDGYAVAERMGIVAALQERQLQVDYLT